MAIVESFKMYLDLILNQRNAYYTIFDFHSLYFNTRIKTENKYMFTIFICISETPLFIIKSLLNARFHMICVRIYTTTVPWVIQSTQRFYFVNTNGKFDVSLVMKYQRFLRNKHGSREFSFRIVFIQKIRDIESNYELVIVVREHVSRLDILNGPSLFSKCL